MQLDVCLGFTERLERTDGSPYPIEGGVVRVDQIDTTQMHQRVAFRKTRCDPETVICAQPLDSEVGVGGQFGRFDDGVSQRSSTVSSVAMKSQNHHETNAARVKTQNQ